MDITGVRVKLKNREFERLANLWQERKTTTSI
jgi:hypothetical protein